MKKIVVAILCALCTNSFAESVTLDSVSYVYELGSTNTFDFAAGATHSCGSNLYRVKGGPTDSNDRKFAMVLVAVTAGKTLIVNAGNCEGDRRLVAWIRVYQ